MKLLSRPWTKGSSISQKTLDLDLTILVKTKNWPTLVFILFHNIYLNMKNTCHGLKKILQGILYSLNYFHNYIRMLNKYIKKIVVQIQYIFNINVITKLANMFNKPSYNNIVPFHTIGFICTIVNFTFLFNVEDNVWPWKISSCFPWAWICMFGEQYLSCKGHVSCNLLGNCCLEINMCTNEEVPWVIIEKRQEKITSMILRFLVMRLWLIISNYLVIKFSFGINIIFYGGVEEW